MGVVAENCNLTTASAKLTRHAEGLMRAIIGFVSVVAIALAAVLAALGPAYRFELIDLAGAFKIMRTIALPTLLAAAAAFLMTGLALWKVRGLTILALFATAVAAAAGYAPLKMKASAEANPFIHDITTDFDNPPQIIAAAKMPRKNPPEYLGAEVVKGSVLSVADSQRQAFPDIQPMTAAADLNTAAETAKRIVVDMGMEILAEGPADSAAGSGWRVEAVSTSFWYGFKDDFIVRLTPLSDGGTRIDVRSQSRVGGSDLGANAKRVREFMERFGAAH
jgi:uncharacterized protein (DUF1499 family)